MVITYSLVLLLVITTVGKSLSLLLVNHYRYQTVVDHHTLWVRFLVRELRRKVETLQDTAASYAPPKAGNRSEDQGTKQYGGFSKYGING